jgi:hypothetical protein
MLALVRFRVPPPSQFQKNKVKARSSVAGKLKMHCTKILSWKSMVLMCIDVMVLKILVKTKIFCECRKNLCSGLQSKLYLVTRRIDVVNTKIME